MYTVEYHPIDSESDLIETFTPEQLAKSWLAGVLPEVDFALTYSSLEHNGLGRYGHLTLLCACVTACWQATVSD